MPKKNCINKPLNHVIHNMKDWNIYKVYNNKNQFLAEVKKYLIENSPEYFHLNDSIEKHLKFILHQENVRLTQKPWKSDTYKDIKFWEEIKKDLLNLQANDLSNEKLILHKITDYYLDEMKANFKISTFKFANKIITYLFSRIIGPFPYGIIRFFRSENRLYNHLKICGDIEKIRSLQKIGTIVIVPTHFSNMDSPTVGLSINNIGLKAVTYGAGSNLFTISWLSKMMTNLGAYKIDRRRKHKLYIKTIMSYSTIALTKDINSLFFPGGTRNRSGRIDEELKTGLLSTTIEAQRLNLINNNSKKIFIVPLILNYHYVFEAPKLINDYLKSMGKEDYIEDENTSNFGLIKRIFKILSANPGMIINFGQPIDVVGNKVDENGISYNEDGNIVKVEDYFDYEGKYIQDFQRDKLYTAKLTESIVDQFKRKSVILSSNFVSFVAFNCLQEIYNEFNLFELLRLVKKDRVINIKYFNEKAEFFLYKIKEAAKQNKFELSDEMENDLSIIIKLGIKNLGASHTNKVLKLKKNDIICTNMNLLYYYQNKLDSFNLLQ